VTAAALTALGSLACRQDMHDQPKCGPKPPFSPITTRPAAAAAQSRGELRDDQVLYTGKVNDEDVTTFQASHQAVGAWTEALRYLLFAYRGRTGASDGIVVQRGRRRAARRGLRKARRAFLCDCGPLRLNARLRRSDQE
jgi:hypothetical protein